MEYRQLGDSDLTVSEASLRFGPPSGGGADDAQYRGEFDAAVDAGINFIDTANVYGALGAAGRALLGAAPSSGAAFEARTGTRIGLYSRGRTTRARTRTRRAPSRAKADRRVVYDALTDHDEFSQCHRYDDTTPLEETMEALNEVVVSGKARYIGFSEWTAEQVHWAAL